MKLSTASVVATIAAFAPSLVSAANITVIVGASQDGTAGLVFVPQQVTAQTGDVVNFMFRGGNHTVTQSSFQNPCAWQFNTATQQNGFNSGFVPYSASTGQVGVYSLEITQTQNPIWFFCGRPPHCKGGMYGAINAPTTGNRTFEQFTANVQSTDEPGLGVTVPFTPPNATPSPTGAASTAASSGAASPTGNGAASSSNGAATSTASNGAAPSSPANQGTGAAGTVTARSAVVLGLAGLVAGLTL